MLNLPEYMRSEAHDGLGLSLKKKEAPAKKTPALLIKSKQAIVPATPKIDLFNPFLDELVGLVNHLRSVTGAKVMIAGGAVRDTLLGREVKDIDVFTTCNISNMIFKLGVTVIESGKVDSYEGAFAVMTINLPGFSQPIQLIEVADMNSHIKTFGLGLSMVSVDANGVHISHQFSTDVKNRTLTILDKNLQAEYSDRISAKYPDFAIKPWAPTVVMKAKYFADLCTEAHPDDESI